MAAPESHRELALHSAPAQGPSVSIRNNRPLPVLPGTDVDTEWVRPFNTGYRMAPVGGTGPTTFDGMTSGEIVDDVLRRIAGHVERRELDAAVALFHEDGVLVGSESWEWAEGIATIEEHLAFLFARPQTYTWRDWEPLVTGTVGAVIWFISPATLVERDGAGERSFPYRLSGVLERVVDGRWLLRLLNGSEPTVGP